MTESTAITPSALARLEAILPRLEKVIEAQEISVENRRAHPDEWHIMRAAKMRRLICKNLVVTYLTTAQDPWLKVPYKDGGGGMNSREQYHRMLDQNLLAGHPRGVWLYIDGRLDAGSRFRLIKIPDDSGKGYLTLERFLHCAVVRVAETKRVNSDMWLQFYNAGTSCDWCKSRK